MQPKDYIDELLEQLDGINHCHNKSRDEKVIFKKNVYWYMPIVISIFISLVVYFGLYIPASVLEKISEYRTFQYITMFFLVTAGIFIAIAFLTSILVVLNRVVITNCRFMHQYWIVNRHIECQLDNISHVVYKQGKIGRIFNIGSIFVYHSYDVIYLNHVCGFRKIKETLRDYLLLNPKGEIELIKHPQTGDFVPRVFPIN